MKYRILIAALFFIVPGLSYLNADIYRWTDSKGNVTFGNLPPADARDVKLMFKETTSGHDARPSGPEEDQSPVEAIIQDLDEATRREEQARKEAESAKAAAPPTRSEMITQEKIKIEKKIQELEALPLDYFGSQKNKRVRIGYYQYRLETLMANPDEYFNNPEPFEGNLATPPAKAQ
jgi:hypothetical protein